MSNYHEDTKNHDIEKIRTITSNMPPYISQYIRSIQFRTTSKTRLEYVRDIRNFFEYLIMENTSASLKDISLEMLNNITKNNIEEYLDYLQHYEKNGKEYKNDTVSIKRKLIALRRFFGYLFTNDMISANVIDKIDIPKVRDKEIIRMNRDEMDDFLNQVEYGNFKSSRQNAYHEKQKVRDLAITTLLLSTGIRVSECVGLNLEDVNMRESSLRIIRKGGKEATVYFSDEAAAYLQEYIEERSLLELENENALFLSSRKQRISVRTIETLVKKYAIGHCGTGKSSTMDAIKWGLTGKITKEDIRYDSPEASIKIIFDDGTSIMRTQSAIIKSDCVHQRAAQVRGCLKVQKCQPVQFIVCSISSHMEKEEKHTRMQTIQ